MLKEIKNLLSFLTAIPINMDKDCLADSAKYMFLFPLIGGFLGLLAGAFALLTSQLLPSLLVGALTLGVILLLTGLHHTDGLLDFGDGLMAHGSAERKIEIMHDQLTGAGGLCLGMLTFLTTAFAISELSISTIIQSLVSVEISAKLSMVTATWVGRAVHKGMNSPFMDAMHGKFGNARLIAALAISATIVVPLLGLTGVILLLASGIASLAIVGIAHRHFGGVTGDVLGATNEIARMVSLIVLVAVIL